MTLIESAVSNSSALSFELFQLLPLQFSGGFIQLAIVFFILAIIAGVVGASGVAGISMSIAKWFVIIFIVLAVISLIL
ncbi:DUF1328 domain-containing protein [Natronocalculus amylovorans]|uniref:UPF0391 membrane protein AArcSt2_15075 n=1 Tax=Natronocalculus amylovorans TaxID=2917812 RepID=A0AAE3K9E3_9EURY|nr:DUF1328 domain-containing protein [Natronocalculus amylovorans]MCL9818262.1 DUF1328 domain-containing protein [Natronocalculus amylovorans]NUE03558.1 DUF1328 domain-containing protein [Halorubraceae archaeon YAN]